MNSLHSSEQWLMFNASNKPSTSSHVLHGEEFFQIFFGDNDTELFLRLHPNISIFSFWMLAVWPLPLAAPNRVLDHSVRFM